MAIKAVIEQARQNREAGDIRDDRGDYRKGSETVDDLNGHILELVKSQNEY